jgi:hypothetical protein
LPPGFPAVPQYFNSVFIGPVLNQPDSSDFAWRTKNSLGGELNVQKRELCVKGILVQDLKFVLGAFQRSLGGIFGVEVDSSLLSVIFNPQSIP